MKIAVGLEEAATSTGLSREMLQKLLRLGLIRGAKVGRRVLIPISELERVCKPGARTATKKTA